jgi:hypothetical protein
MRLPHEQTARDVERDVQDRDVRGGGLLTDERGVRAVVGDALTRRRVPEHQQEAGDEQYDDACEGDDAEQV